MAEIKVYCYKNCGTCRKAFSWLNERQITYTELPVRESPPTLAELRLALKTEDNIRKLINTSSKDYRDLGLKDRLDRMQPQDVFELLRQNGNLVKRPFVVANGMAWAGFKPEVWETRLG